MKRLAIAAAIVLAASGARADGFTTAPAANSVLAFTSGCYLKAYGQGRFVNHRADMGGVAIDGLAQTGVGGGLGAGCDAVYRQFLVGVFADWTADRSDFRVTTPVTTTTMPWGNDWSAGARIGILPTKGVLVYALGGYTRAPDTSMSTTVGGIPLATNPISGSKGLVVGGGIEALVTPTVAVSLEYRHVGFDSEASMGLLPMQFDTRNDIVRVGLSLRFPALRLSN